MRIGAGDNKTLDQERGFAVLLGLGLGLGLGGDRVTVQYFDQCPLLLQRPQVVLRIRGQVIVPPGPGSDRVQWLVYSARDLPALRQVPQYGVLYRGLFCIIIRINKVTKRLTPKNEPKTNQFFIRTGQCLFPLEYSRGMKFSLGQNQRPAQGDHKS